jgi:hypothetical protein
LQTRLIVRYCDRGRKPWQLQARIVRFRRRIRLDRTEDDVDVENFVATHAAGGGGKMSRDCCFKYAPSTLKHMSALKDRP